MHFTCDDCDTTQQSAVTKAGSSGKKHLEVLQVKHRCQNKDKCGASGQRTQPIKSGGKDCVPHHKVVHRHARTTEAIADCKQNHPELSCTARKKRANKI